MVPYPCVHPPCRASNRRIDAALLATPMTQVCDALSLHPRPPPLPSSPYPCRHASTPATAQLGSFIFIDALPTLPRRSLPSASHSPSPSLIRPPPACPAPPGRLHRMTFQTYPRHTPLSPSLSHPFPRPHHTPLPVLDVAGDPVSLLSAESTHLTTASG